MMPALSSECRYVLLLRMHVCGFGVPVRILAMVQRRGSVFLGFVVIAVVKMMRRLPVVVRSCLMMRRGIVMVIAGRVLLFVIHGEILPDPSRRKECRSRAKSPSKTRHEFHSQSNCEAAAFWGDLAAFDYLPPRWATD